MGSRQRDDGQALVAAAGGAPTVVLPEVPAWRRVPRPQQRPLVDPLAAYLVTLAPKSQRVMIERLRLVARVMGEEAHTIDELRRLPWHRLGAPELDYIRGRLSGEHAPATVNLTLAAVRGVLKQARNHNLLTDEEYRRATEVKLARGSRLPPGRVVTPGELRALVTACRADPSAHGVRDRAILAVLYIGGVRRSELAALDRADYTANPPTLRIRHGKGDVERLVPLTGSAAGALTDWLRLRDGSTVACEALFLSVTQHGRIVPKRLNSVAVYNLLRKRAKQAGIARLAPHDLRRSFVSDLLDAGVDLSGVQKLAGHASPITTARYDRRGEATKRANIEKLHFPDWGD